MKTGLHRGHHMTVTPGDPQGWRYTDGVPVAMDPSRPCGACGRADDEAGHDGCLGELPGVVNACCGHGNVRDAWVVLADGRRLAKEAAVALFREHGRLPVVNLAMAYYAFSWGAMAKTAMTFPERSDKVVEWVRRAAQCARMSLEE